MSDSANGNQTKKKKKVKVKKQINKQLVKAGLGKGTRMRQMLINHSAYFNSIMDPMNHVGVKIPDSCVLQTATTQCIQRVQVAANSAGLLCGLLLNCGVYASSGPIDYWTTAPTAVISTLVWTGATKTYASGLNGIAARARLVSAGVYASYQGTSLNNSGRMSVVFYPKTALSSNANTLPPITYSTDIGAAPYLGTFPMSKGFGKCIALPTDDTSRSFTNTGSVQVGSQQNVGCVGYCLILCDGMVNGQIVEFTIVENYEFIPLTNALNLLQPTPSKSDPIEMSLVANELVADPWSAVRSTTSEVTRGSATTPVGTGASMVPSQPHPLQEKTFFEKLLSGVDQALPVVAKGAKTALDIGAMVAPLLA